MGHFDDTVSHKLFDIFFNDTFKSIFGLDSRRYRLPPFFQAGIDTCRQKLFGLVPPTTSVFQTDLWIRAQTDHLFRTHKPVAKTPQFAFGLGNHQEQGVPIGKLVILVGVGFRRFDRYVGERHVWERPRPARRYPEIGWIFWNFVGRRWTNEAHNTIFYKGLRGFGDVLK